MTDQAFTPIDVVVVDDHAIFRSGLKADLDQRIRVVAEAATVEEAIEKAERLPQLERPLLEAGADVAGR